MIFAVALWAALAVLSLTWPDSELHLGAWLSMLSMACLRGK